MERTVYGDLLRWKSQARRKPLVLQGVRQCGKTYALKRLGIEHFRQTAYFNFEQDPSLCDVFDYDFNTSRILRELSVIKGYGEIDLTTTLVIFDEIQACPKAITSLKYFCEEKPEMYLSAAGSLLGPAISHHNISFPVGKVTFLRMYPLSFGEFAMACGLEREMALLAECAPERPVPAPIAERMTDACRRFMAIGGMPEAVSTWISTHDYTAVDKVLGDILQSYANDFGKYLSADDALKVGWIWDSIPVQLAKENNKWVFSHVKKGKRAAELENALQWLVKSDQIFTLSMVGNPGLPLSFYSDATYFKVYLSDVGLLRMRAGLTAQSVIEESPLYTNFKGAMTENYVMNELLKGGHTPYFWRSQNEAEVDFIVECGERIVPIEVKSDTNTRAKSYLTYCKRYCPQVGVRLSMKNVGDNRVGDTLSLSLPLYKTPWLRAIIARCVSTE